MKATKDINLDTSLWSVFYSIKHWNCLFLFYFFWLINLATLWTSLTLPAFFCLVITIRTSKGRGFSFFFAIYRNLISTVRRIRIFVTITGNYTMICQEEKCSEKHQLCFIMSLNKIGNLIVCSCCKCVLRRVSIIWHKSEGRDLGSKS